MHKRPIINSLINSIIVKQWLDPRWYAFSGSNSIQCKERQESKQLQCRVVNDLRAVGAEYCGLLQPRSQRSLSDEIMLMEQKSVSREKGES